MWEDRIDPNAVVEIRARSICYLGAGTIGKTGFIAAELKKRGVKNALVVTGKGSHIKTGAWDKVKAALADEGVGYFLYDKVTPNPTVDQVDEAVAGGKSVGAGAVVAIGGGSPIDAGKVAAILLANPARSARDVCGLAFAPETAVPIVAVNLTHGTGTEVNRFAVVSIPENEFKPALAFECVYPAYSIDDPALMGKLPERQTVFVSVDAVNHVIEACTTTVASPYSIGLAREVVRLVAKYLPLAKKDPGDLRARYFLLYASMIAGIAFDNGLLHLTHALEHPLSGVKPELSHGSGLGIILPGIVKEIYPAKGEVLADVLSPIVPGLAGKANEAGSAAAGVRGWLTAVGIPENLRAEGFTAGDVAKLVNLAFTTPSLGVLLGLSPVEATREVVTRIYETAM
ncbi:MAG: iron-containing alcohol dehydrogenase [Planctomycetota bacterium]|jgi:alcohol dehydrogenase class IV|nr:iron-containing alcohol dehydrogenase [Planctomycetota bacterium]